MRRRSGFVFPWSLLLLSILAPATAFIPARVRVAVPGRAEVGTRAFIKAGLQPRRTAAPLRATGLPEAERELIDVEKARMEQQEAVRSNAGPSFSFTETEKVEQSGGEESQPLQMPSWISADRTDEERKVNLMINAGFIFLVVFTVVTKLVTVDFEAWRGWTTTEIFLRIPLDNWQSYTSTLHAQPVLTKGFTSFSVYLLGDWVAQLYEGKSLEEIDRGRVARSAIAGLVGHGPLSHIWYEVCENFFNNVLGWTEWWVTIPKIFTDQVLWSPIWNGTYILLLGLMKRETFEEIWRSIRTTAIPLITSGLKLWPAAHIVTYGLIPVENRLLWVDMVEILWVTILSRQAAQAEEAAQLSSSDESAGGKGQGEARVEMALADEEKAMAAARREDVMR